MADFIITKAFLDRVGFCDKIIGEFISAFGEDGQVNLAHDDTRDMFETWINESENKELASNERWLDIFKDFRSSIAAIEEFGVPEDTATDDWILINPLNGDVEIYNSIEECRVRRIEIINEYMDTSELVSVSRKFINEFGHEVIRAIPQEEIKGTSQKVKENVEAEETTE